MEEIILVGMADLNICCSPDSITTVALGSCVGIVLYDPLLKVAGLAHIMLPDSTQITRNQNKAKFADTAIDTLIKLMEVEYSIRKSRLVSKIAGGAQMFNFKTQNDTLRVGEHICAIFLIFVSIFICFIFYYTIFIISFFACC